MIRWNVQTAYMLLMEKDSHQGSDVLSNSESALGLVCFILPGAAVSLSNMPKLSPCQTLSWPVIIDSIASKQGDNALGNIRPSVSSLTGEPYQLSSATHIIWGETVLSAQPFTSQVAFLFAVGGREDCHNPCNLKCGLNLSYFNMGEFPECFFFYRNISNRGN